MCTFSRQNATDALRFSLSEHGPSFALGAHFRLIEMASRDGADEVLVHPALIVLLSRLRAHFGRAVTITSGYRSPDHNRSVRGAVRSRHVSGMAADVVVAGVSPSDVADYLETLSPGGLGRYDTFTHVDVDGADRRWDFRTR